MALLFGPASQLEAGLAAFARGKWARAWSLLEGPATTGDRLAGYHMGLMELRGVVAPRNPTAAAGWFRRSAEAGLPAAQDALALLLMTGDGTPRDAMAARALLEAAAERGYPPSMARLAELSGPEMARDWLRRAADAGYAPAFLDLSFRCERDDPGEALALLYAHAALSGDEASARKAKALALELSPADIKLAQRKGRDYLKRAAQHRAGYPSWGEDE